MLSRMVDLSQPCGFSCRTSIHADEAAHVAATYTQILLDGLPGQVVLR